MLFAFVASLPLALQAHLFLRKNKSYAAARQQLTFAVQVILMLLMVKGRASTKTYIALSVKTQSTWCNCSFGVLLCISRRAKGVRPQPVGICLCGKLPSCPPSASATENKSKIDQTRYQNVISSRTHHCLFFWNSYNTVGRQSIFREPQAIPRRSLSGVKNILIVGNLLENVI